MGHPAKCTPRGVAMARMLPYEYGLNKTLFYITIDPMGQVGSSPGSRWARSRLNEHALAGRLGLWSDNGLRRFARWLGYTPVHGEMTLMQVMFGLALCVLIGGMASTAAAARGIDTTAPQRLYGRAGRRAIWFSDDKRESVRSTPARCQPTAGDSRRERMVPADLTASLSPSTSSRLVSDDGGAPGGQYRSRRARGLVRGRRTPLTVTAPSWQWIPRD